MALRSSRDGGSSSETEALDRKEPPWQAPRRSPTTRSSNPSPPPRSDRGRAGRGARDRPVHRRQAPRHPRSRGHGPPGAGRARERGPGGGPLEAPRRPAGRRRGTRRGRPTPSRPSRRRRRATAGAGRARRPSCATTWLPARARTSDPTQIGKALGRSQGAVSNALARLEAAGEAQLVSASPRRYRIAPTGSSRPGAAVPPRHRARPATTPTSGYRLPHLWGSRLGATPRGAPRRLAEKFLSAAVAGPTRRGTPAPGVDYPAALTCHERRGRDRVARDSPGFGGVVRPGRLGRIRGKSGVPAGLMAAPKRKELPMATRRRPLTDSPFDTLEKTFALLVTGPNPLALDGTGARRPAGPGDPARRAEGQAAAPLDPFEVRDAIVDELVARAQPEGGAGPSAWPGCSSRACAGPSGRSSRPARARPTTSRPRPSPRSWPPWPAASPAGPASPSRLCWLARKGAKRLLRAELAERARPGTDPVSAAPPRPWGHPDLVLAEAVAGRGDLRRRRRADRRHPPRRRRPGRGRRALGLGYWACHKRRRRAEAALVEWVTGDDYPPVRVCPKEGRNPLFFWRGSSPAGPVNGPATGQASLEPTPRR